MIGVVAVFVSWGSGDGADCFGGERSLRRNMRRRSSRKVVSEGIVAIVVMVAKLYV